MTREEALESGIRQAWRFVGDPDCETPVDAATEAVRYINTPEELEGFAVGLTMIAVEVAEIARKRREAVAATSEAQESKPDGDAFTYERVEVAGPAGDPIWVYERRPLRTG